MPKTNKLLRAALQIQEFCKQRKWHFCFIGALAVQRWGEPRLTQDVDLTILTGFGKESTYIAALLKKFKGRIEDTAQFAVANRVLLLEDREHIPIDISLGAMPFEAHVVARASAYRFSKEVSLRTCSAEDLIVLKAFANRPKDWLDIDGIIQRHKSRLDKKLILAELAPMVELKEEPEILLRLNKNFK